MARAINNFKRVELTDGTLIVHGETLDEDSGEASNLGPDVKIFVAVIDIDHPTNRADPPVDDPSVSPWTARTNVHHFNDHDRVIAVGAAIGPPSPDGNDRPFLWGDDFTINETIVGEITIDEPGTGG